MGQVKGRLTEERTGERSCDINSMKILIALHMELAICKQYDLFG